MEEKLKTFLIAANALLKEYNKKNSGSSGYDELTDSLLMSIEDANFILTDKTARKAWLTTKY